jgi:hypothetical protein
VSVTWLTSFPTLPVVSRFLKFDDFGTLLQLQHVLA